MSDLILYTTEDSKSRIQLRANEQTVWLTQLEMADFFYATKQNISLHLKNLFEDGELDPAVTVKESLTVQIERAGGNYRGILGSSNGGGKRDSVVSWCRYGSGFQPFVACVSQKPRALPWAGMTTGLWPSESGNNLPGLWPSIPARQRRIRSANGATPYQPGATPQDRRPKPHEG